MLKSTFSFAIDKSIRTLMTSPDKYVFFVTHRKKTCFHWASCDVIGKFVISTLTVDESGEFVQFEQDMLSVEFSHDLECFFFGAFHGPLDRMFETHKKMLSKVLGWKDDSLLENAKILARACFFPYKHKRHAEKIKMIPIVVGDDFFEIKEEAGKDHHVCCTSSNNQLLT